MFAAALLGTFAAFRATVPEMLRVAASRPDASTWKRTMCGSPAGVHPAVPEGLLEIGVDRSGNDMPPCGSQGCVLASNATAADCEAKCAGALGPPCVAYVFAPRNCSGEAGPICWLKSAMGTARKGAACRNSRVLGQPASEGADIPSVWAKQVSADPANLPLKLYPRPQMVRARKSAAIGTTALRDFGDASNWANLNGLWEWEPTTPGGGASPPFGRALGGSILVPFPVEACLSGVAPNSSAAIVKDMWYRITFDAERSGGENGGATLLHFGAIDWQSAVYINGVLLGNHTGGYSAIDFDVTAHLKATGNELLVFAFDPSDEGAQPAGKQRISAISAPGGDTYTPSSGIWQTVWMEAAPASYVAELVINQVRSSQRF